ncbi:MAG: hypothetical protein KGL12_17015 [Rhodospirillales bacterium]|nr:hypothetical protein [Rhodospirillales bacterium]
MTEHSAVFTGPETQDQFLADRMRFWGSFTRFTVGCTIALIVLLVGMAVFLL